MSKYIDNESSIVDRIALKEKELQQAGKIGTKLTITSIDRMMLERYYNMNESRINNYHGMKIVIGQELKIE